MFRHLYCLAPEGAPAAAATTPAATPAGSPATSATTTNAGKPGSVDKSTQVNTPAADAKPAAPELFEIKVGGKPKKVTRDELIKLAELGDGADQKFQEAAKLRKQAESYLAKMRNPKDAIALLQDPALGLSEEQVRAAFEEWYSERFIKREKMTPAERRLADAEAKIKQYEDEKAAERAEKQKQADQELDAKTAAEIQKEIIETIQTSGLPKSRFTVSRIAYWTRVNEEQKMNAPRELIVQQVQKEMRQLMDDMVQSSDGEVLEKLLGEGTTKKLRKLALERLRAKRAKLGEAPPATTPKEKKEPGEKKEKLRSADVNRNLRNLRLGKW
jgi:hypothetical protein